MRRRAAWTWSRALVLALAAVALGSAPAAAQGFDDWDDDEGDASELDRSRDSLYLSLRGAYMIDHFSGGTFDGTGRTFDRGRIENTFGADVRLGYRFAGVLGVEAEAEWFDSFDLEETTFLGGQFDDTRTAKYSGVTGTVNGRFYLLPGAIQPYVVGGAGVMYVHQKVQTPFRLPYKPGSPPSRLEPRHDVGPALRGGLGVEIYGFENDAIALTFEGSYVAGLADASDYAYVSTQAGLLFRW